MAKPKTGPSDANVNAFLATVSDQRKRKDSEEIVAMMSRAVGEAPTMWGASIVGFGRYRYRYDSGREGEWMLCGFSPRRQSLVLYIMPGFKSYDKLMKKLGKFKTGKSCLYLKTLDDIDRDVLQSLIESSVSDMRARYETSP